VESGIVKDSYFQLFGSSPDWTVRAPGRINLIGEHIDYYGGYVMPAAIDRCTELQIGPGTASKAMLYSRKYGELVSFDKDPVPSSHWSAYPDMALQILRESGYETAPFRLWIGSDLPAGAGLASSAALLCGFITALNRFNGWSLPASKIAYLAQAAEHRLGTPCGLMDQYACLFGKKDTFLLMDCGDLTIKYIPVDLRQYELILVNTLVHHQLNDGGFARRRKEGEGALESLKSYFSKTGTYRDFNLDELDEIPVLTDTEARRARHAISEHRRVLRFAERVGEGDWEGAGQCMYETHASLRDDYEVSCAEADFIVEVSRATGAAGARIMGGGFGGCVLCLVDKEKKTFILNQVVEGYVEKFRIAPEVIEVKLGELEISGSE